MTAIAAKFGVTLAALEAVNPQVTNPNDIHVGQVLIIPIPPPPGMGFAGIVSEQLFTSMFPQANSFYTYPGLVATTQSNPSFCTAGTAEQNRQEAAAFLSNVAQETGFLQYTVEQDVADPGSYCKTGTDYPCSTTQPPYYYGRGPLHCRGITTMVLVGRRLE